MLLAGDRRLLTPGILVAVGALACWALWRLEFVSTWCALAALCSVALLGWVRGRPASSHGASPCCASLTPKRCLPGALRSCWLPESR
ncbi:DUF6629 family protein [Streptomyces sp. MMS24-I31]|uniref:DUF6629 family protein n=1 Tax=Streptomyces sp. MMS24-I31 TaxID=3351563 RepID=UPI003896BBF5